MRIALISIFFALVCVFAQEEQSAWGYLQASALHHQIEFFRAEFGGNTPCFKHKIAVSKPLDACNFDPSDKEKYEDKVVVVERGNCFFSQKAVNLEKFGAKAMILINSENDLFRMPTSPEHVVNIPAVLVRNREGADLMDLMNHTDVTISFMSKGWACDDEIDVKVEEGSCGNKAYDVGMLEFEQEEETPDFEVVVSSESIHSFPVGIGHQFIVTDSTFCNYEEHLDNLRGLFTVDDEFFLVVDRGECSFRQKYSIALKLREEFYGVRGILVSNTMQVLEDIILGEFSDDKKVLPIGMISPAAKDFMKKHATSVFPEKKIWLGEEVGFKATEEEIMTWTQLARVDASIDWTNISEESCIGLIDRIKNFGVPSEDKQLFVKEYFFPLIRNLVNGFEIDES